MGSEPLLQKTTLDMPGGVCATSRCANSSAGRVVKKLEGA